MIVDLRASLIEERGNEERDVNVYIYIYASMGCRMVGSEQWQWCTMTPSDFVIFLSVITWDETLTSNAH